MSYYLVSLNPETQEVQQTSTDCEYFGLHDTHEDAVHHLLKSWANFDGWDLIKLNYEVSGSKLTFEEYLVAEFERNFEVYISEV